MIYLTRVLNLLLKENRGSWIILIPNRLQTSIGQVVRQVLKIILDSTHPQRNSTVGYSSKQLTIYFIGSHRVKKHKKYMNYERDSIDSDERRHEKHEKRSKHRSSDQSCPYKVN